MTAGSFKHDISYCLSACLHIRCLHGDVFQNERNEIISAFKKQEFPILVATDVAARGLDIPHIRNVVNFDVARWVLGYAVGDNNTTCVAEI